MNCFKCNKKISSATVEPSNVYDMPSNATVWNTTGNYGSTIYDSISNECLLLFICDKCLKNNQKNVIRRTTHVTPDQHKRSIFNLKEYQNRK